MSLEQLNQALNQIKVVQGNEASPDMQQQPTRSEEEDWQLNREALDRANQDHNWSEALRLLVYLGNKDGHPEAYRAQAQAAWLALKSTTPIHNVVYTLFNLLSTMGPGHITAGPIASLANFMCQVRTPDHAEAELAQIQAQQMLRFVGDGHKLENQAQFSQWVQENRLDDPEHFIPLVMELIDNLVGGEWWIDRGHIQQEMESANAAKASAG